MITKIHIKNYILIDEIELDLSKGLNIITGETGAGKSILINAIDIVFGAKVGKEIIKNGADKAVIEITLHNKKQDLANIFNEYEIDDCGEEIILSREITQTGSRSRVNGCLVNQEFIKNFRELFLDIHSQHQTYSFLQSKYHISLLDSYIKSSNLDKFKEEYDVYRNLIAELDKLKQASEKTEEQIDFLKFQVNEIEVAALSSINEDDELNNELSVLENVEKLKELTGSSYWTLSGDDNSILDGLFQIKSSLAKASALDNSVSEIESDFINSLEALREVASSLRDYSSSLENDTERINEIQERLFLIEKLKRKYGGTIEKVIETGDKLRSELNSIEFSSQNIEDLEVKISQKLSEIISLAKEISDERKKYATVLSQKVVEKLEKLELPKVKFEINIEQSELSVNGIDKVEFLISTNISEGLKPLAKVASGGELSRVMLAIKSIFAQEDNIDTIIFDEIDTGISGKTSQAVADEVKILSEFMQIIMITHQAIIASKSDRHFYVRKIQDDKTTVSIDVLENEAKLRAVAELASGMVTDESMKFAEMLIG